MAADRRHFWHLGRRHECRGARRRLDRGRRRGRACRARRLLGARGRRPRCSAPCSARRSIACWVAGRSTPRRSSSALDLHGAARSRPTISIHAASIRCSRSWRQHRFRAARAVARSSCSSPRPMCAPAAAASSAMPRSRPTSCLLRPACRRCSRPSRSTARPIGTAAIAGNPTITPLMRESDVAGHDPGADQSARASRHAAIGERDPQSPERGVLQRRADEGAAHDRAAAPGGRSRAPARARAGRRCACTGS